MQLEQYQEKVKLNLEKSSAKEHICELLELFCTLANVQAVSYYKYNYGYNDFFYAFTLNDQGEKIDASAITSTQHKLSLEHNGVIFGYLLLSNAIETTPILTKLLEKIIKYLKQEKEIEKRLYDNEIPFDLLLIYDKPLEKEALKLKTSLKALFNVEIILDDSLYKHMNLLNQKETKHIILFLVEDQQSIQTHENTLKQINELIIVIGPNDHRVPIYCGKVGIENYLNIENYNAQELKEIILKKRNSLLSKNRFGNKIIALSGIAGGIGTTTLSMNISDLIATNLPNKNLLYIDLSTTKAVSNLFLEKNPLPEKTIIDLINSNEFNIENNLENGLVKIKENFYAITGIQKHIDQEFIQKDVFIEKFLEYISASSNYFNFIIIDTGVADASNLKTTVYDIVNELWVITEMTLPHISQLKTFYSLMKRAGLKDKISFIVNRYDSQNAISVNDVTSILNMNSEEKMGFDSFKIPNDYAILGKCWNYCELVTKNNEESTFIKRVDSILQDKNFYTKHDQKIKKKSWLESLLKR
jgi:Flp pilus assembly CpaE family ATPase